MSTVIAPGRRQRLSALIFATGTSRRVAPTIESVRDWADEIVLHDESPQSIWRAVARRYGVRWIPAPPELAATEARRRAFYQTDGDWVLVLAADERIDWARGGHMIRRLLDPQAPPAFTLTVVDRLDPREPSLQEESVRLVRKRPGVAFASDPVTALSFPGRAGTPRPSEITLFRADPHPTGEGIGARAVSGWRSGAGSTAIESLRTALARAGDADESPDGRRGASRLLSSILIAEHRWHEAADEVERELIDDRGEARVEGESAAFLLAELGRAETGRRHLTRAAACFERALVLAPGLYAVHAGRAEFLLASNRIEEAASAWLRAAALRPDLGAPRRHAAECLEALGRLEDALALIHEADRVDHEVSLASIWTEVDSPVQVEVADDTADDIMVDDAPADDGGTEELSAPLPMGILEATIEENSADDVMTTGDPADEGITLIISPGAGPAEPEHLTDVANGMPLASDTAEPQALEERRREDLEKLEQEALGRPDDHETHLQVGIAWFALREWNRAESALRRAVRQTGKPLARPQLAIAWCRLAECSLERGDLNEAEREASSALTLDGTSTEARLVLGRIAYRQHRFHEAVREFRRLLAGAAEAIPVDRGIILRELGVALYRDGRHAESAQILAEAARRLGGDAMLQLYLGNALAHAGRLEEALEAFREAHRLDPSLSEARNNLVVLTVDLGNRLFDAGRYREVLDRVSGVPTTPELLFLSAVARHALRDTAGARRDLEALNAVDDRFVEAHWNLALVCREQGDLPAAVAALGRFRHLAPTDPRGKALEEALKSTRTPADT